MENVLFAFCCFTSFNFLPLFGNASFSWALSASYFSSDFLLKLCWETVEFSTFAWFVLCNAYGILFWLSYVSICLHHYNFKFLVYGLTLFINQSFVLYIPWSSYWVETLTNISITVLQFECLDSLLIHKLHLKSGDEVLQGYELADILLEWVMSSKQNSVSIDFTVRPFWTRLWLLQSVIFNKSLARHHPRFKLSSKMKYLKEVSSKKQLVTSKE